MVQAVHAHGHFQVEISSIWNLLRPAQFSRENIAQAFAHGRLPVLNRRSIAERYETGGRSSAGIESGGELTHTKIYYPYPVAQNKTTLWVTDFGPADDWSFPSPARVSIFLLAAHLRRLHAKPCLLPRPW